MFTNVVGFYPKSRTHPPDCFSQRRSNLSLDMVRKLDISVTKILDGVRDHLSSRILFISHTKKAVNNFFDHKKHFRINNGN